MHSATVYKPVLIFIARDGAVVRRCPPEGSRDPASKSGRVLKSGYASESFGGTYCRYRFWTLSQAYAIKISGGRNPKSIF